MEPGVIPETLRLIGGAFHAKGWAFIEAASNGGALEAAVLIAVLAGSSELAGQSFVLIANRTPLYRIGLALALTGLIYPAMAFAWTMGALFIAHIFGASVDIPEANAATAAFGVVALAFAPRLLGLFAVIPYFGVGLGWLLDLWVMALVIFGFDRALGLPTLAAAATGVLGWIVQYLLRRLLGRMFARPIRRLRRAVIGTPLARSPQAMVEKALRRVQRKDAA